MKEKLIRKRNHFIGLWLSEHEYRRLSSQCFVTGLSTSALIRQLLACSQLRPRPPDQYAALLRELSAIGNNINQIAYWANAKKSVSETAILEAAALARKAWELVKHGL